MAGKQEKSAGFSYIEALVVLAIAGLLLAVALARTSDPNRILEKDRLISEIRFGLQMARSRAISEATPCEIVFDLDANRMTIEKTGFMREIGQNFALKITSASSTVTTGNKAMVTYYPDGSSSGAEISISYREPLQPIAVLRVDWVTGRVVQADD